MRLSGSIAVHSVEVFVQSHEFAKKYNWQCASGKLAICAARIEGSQAGPRALLHELHHYTLQVKIKKFLVSTCPSLVPSRPRPPVVGWMAGHETTRLRGVDG